MAEHSLDQAPVCIHCGGIINDTTSEFCCSGCVAAYHIIQGLGLDSYYEKRILDADIPLNIPVPMADIDFSPYVVSDKEISTLHLMVDGIHCAACVWLIEEVLSKASGVTYARMNMTTRRLTLKWQTQKTDPKAILEQIAKLGYRVTPYDPNDLELKDITEQKELLLCLAVAGFATGNVMLLSVAVWSGDNMGEATRSFFHLLSALITVPVVAYSGRPFFRSAWSSVRNLRVNMDVPISLGVILATALSLHETAVGNYDAYFDSAITLLFFLLIGRYLDKKTRTKAGMATAQLVKMQSSFVNIEQSDGTVKTIKMQEVRIGDVIVVPKGSNIGADGIVVEGSSQINNSLISGESLPVNINVGDKVIGGAVNLNSPIKVKVTASGEKTVLAELARLVEEASTVKSKYVHLADRVVRFYAPVVHSLALITFVGWLMAGYGVYTATVFAIAVLIVTCPCALALAIPSVQVAVSSLFVKRGIILKNASSLERLKDIDCIVFDKTGTLTKGEFKLAHPVNMEDLKLAASLAISSNHPLSKAIITALNMEVVPIKVKEISGKGLEAMKNGIKIRLGSSSFCKIPTSLQSSSNLAELWLKADNKPPVRFAFIDEVRENAKKIITNFNNAGIPTFLISGDRDQVVKNLARDLNIKSFKAEISPQGKYTFIEQLKNKGYKPLMVGDGINDAPSISASHVGISLGSATNIARSAADIILQGDNLSNVEFAWKMAKRASATIKLNFIITLCYNAIAIPLAMMGKITPLYAAVFMSLSSITVMLNSIRLANNKE